jgi:hypothetical protein
LLNVSNNLGDLWAKGFQFFFTQLKMSELRDLLDI